MGIERTFEDGLCQRRTKTYDKVGVSDALAIARRYAGHLSGSCLDGVAQKEVDAVSAYTALYILAELRGIRVVEELGILVNESDLLRLEIVQNHNRQTDGK